MNFILGGGIAGFVVALYFEKYTILAKGKGQDANYYGPRILERCKEVDSFIAKFINKDKKVVEPKIYKCGYSVNGKITSKLSEEMKKSYLIKTRGEKNWKEFLESGINKQKVELEGYDSAKVYRELIDQFNLRARRIFIFIKEIDKEKKVIRGTNSVYKGIKLAFLYNKLINTLPAILFNSFIEKNIVRVSDSQIYVCVIESKKFYDSMKELDFIYYPQDNIPYYRATKVGKNRIVLESRRVFFPKKDLPFSCELIKTSRIPFGKIVDLIPSLEVDSIVHVGRYALANQSLKMHSLIRMLERKEVKI